MIAQGGPEGPPSCLYMKDGGGRNFTDVENYGESVRAPRTDRQIYGNKNARKKAGKAKEKHMKTASNRIVQDLWRKMQGTVANATK